MDDEGNDKYSILHMSKYKSVPRRSGAQGISTKMGSADVVHFHHLLPWLRLCRQHIALGAEKCTRAAVGCRRQVERHGLLNAVEAGTQSKI